MDCIKNNFGRQKPCECELCKSEKASESALNDLLSTDNINRVLWELSELSCSEPENIECNDLEIMGEDENGRDGYCTVQITEVAKRALNLIQALRGR